MDRWGNRDRNDAPRPVDVSRWRDEERWREHDRDRHDDRYWSEDRYRGDDRYRDVGDRHRDEYRWHGRDRDDLLGRDRNPEWGGIPGYRPGGDFGWRGTELDRGFRGRYGEDRGGYHREEPSRYRDDDRYRTSTGDPYYDRGYERERDTMRGRDVRFRDRESSGDYWDDYPWSRGRGW